tara:strand:+ start:366 stop:788 length:423 start_codon:yes stop_codon:yes gene_type:complete
MTPNKFGKILDKLPKEKTELTKIELSLAGDIKKSLNLLKGLMKKGDSMNDKMENLEGKIEAAISKMVDMSKPAESMMEEIYELTDAGKDLLRKANVAAKELGVSPEDIEGYKEFEEVRRSGYFVGKRLQDSLFNADAYRK